MSSFVLAVQWGSLLLGWDLAHVDPDADDLARLDACGAGGEVIPAGAVGGPGIGVLRAGPPRARLPVVHGAGVLVAVPHLLQRAAVWTQRPPWSTQRHASVSLSIDPSRSAVNQAIKLAYKSV